VPAVLSGLRPFSLMMLSLGVIHVYDHPGNVIETHEHVGDFKEP